MARKAHNLFYGDEFPKHAPVIDETVTGVLACGWIDPATDRLCGRWLNYGWQGLRHNPPMGVPHPRGSRHGA